MYRNIFFYLSMINFLFFESITPSLLSTLRRKTDSIIHAFPQVSFNKIFYSFFHCMKCSKNNEKLIILSAFGVSVTYSVYLFLQVRRKNDAIKSKNDAIKSKDEEINQSMKNIQELTQKNNESINQQTKEIDELTKQNNQLQLSQKELTDSLEKVQNALKELNIKHTEKNETVNLQAENVLNLQTALKALRLQKVELEENFEKLQVENKKNFEEINKLTNELKAGKEEIKNSNEILNYFNNYKNKVLEKEKTIEELQKKINNLTENSAGGKKAIPKNKK